MSASQHDDVIRRWPMPGWMIILRCSGSNLWNILVPTF